MAPELGYFMTGDVDGFHVDESLFGRGTAGIRTNAFALWTVEVRDEFRRGGEKYPELEGLLGVAWLPDPIRLTAQGELRAIGYIRGALGVQPEIRLSIWAKPQPASPLNSAEQLLSSMTATRGDWLTRGESPWSTQWGS